MCSEKITIEINGEQMNVIDQYEIIPVGLIHG
nr:MAG TPA: hypothetical protein [Caudoviricetes sp.]